MPLRFSAPNKNPFTFWIKKAAQGLERLTGLSSVWEDLMLPSMSQSPATPACSSRLILTPPSPLRPSSPDVDDSTNLEVVEQLRRRTYLEAVCVSGRVGS